LRISEAANHHFLPANTFDLDPVTRTRADMVRGIDTLRDDALQPARAQLFEHRRTGAADFRAVAQIGFRPLQQILQQLLTSFQRFFLEIAAIEIDKVEDTIDKISAGAVR
jgi:hypothetical protein